MKIEKDTKITVKRNYNHRKYRHLNCEKSISFKIRDFIFWLLLLSTIFVSLGWTDIVAVYYPWYAGPNLQPSQIPAGSWNSNWSHWADGPADYEGVQYTLPDNPPTIFIPQLGFYSSSSTVITNQHVQWAQKAGIDTFAISTFPPEAWYTKWGYGGVPHDSAYRAIFSAASSHNFKLCFHLEGDYINPDTGQTWAGYYFHDTTQAHVVARSLILHITTYYHPYSVGYRRNGKLLVYIYNAFAQSTDTPNDVRNFWTQVRNEVGTATGEELCLISYGARWRSDKALFNYWEYQNVYDGIYGYNDKVVTTELEKPILDEALFGITYPAVQFDQKLYNLTHNQLGYWSVLPGGDDSAVRQPGVSFRRDGNTYIRAWMHCFYRPKANRPDIFITSWNEWHESTIIEPATSVCTNTHGKVREFVPLNPYEYQPYDDKYLLLTKDLKKYLQDYDFVYSSDIKSALLVSSTDYYVWPANWVRNDAEGWYLLMMLLGIQTDILFETDYSQNATQFRNMLTPYDMIIIPSEMFADTTRFLLQDSMTHLSNKLWVNSSYDPLYAAMGATVNYLRPYNYWDPGYTIYRSDTALQAFGASSTIHSGSSDRDFYITSHTGELLAAYESGLPHTIWKQNGIGSVYLIINGLVGHEFIAKMIWKWQNDQQFTLTDSERVTSAAETLDYVKALLKHAVQREFEKQFIRDFSGYVEILPLRSTTEQVCYLYAQPYINSTVSLSFYLNIGEILHVTIKNDNNQVVSSWESLPATVPHNEIVNFTLFPRYIGEIRIGAHLSTEVTAFELYQ